MDNTGTCTVFLPSAAFCVADSCYGRRIGIRKRCKHKVYLRCDRVSGGEDWIYWRQSTRRSCTSGDAIFREPAERGFFKRALHLALLKPGEKVRSHVWYFGGGNNSGFFRICEHHPPILLWRREPTCSMCWRRMRSSKNCLKRKKKSSDLATLPSFYLLSTPAANRTSSLNVPLVRQNGSGVMCLAVISQIFLWLEAFAAVRAQVGTVAFMTESEIREDEIIPNAGVGNSQKSENGNWTKIKNWELYNFPQNLN